VYQHWLAFKSEKPVEWLSEGAAPSLEQTWEFVRDGLANVREDSLAVRGEPPCSRETLLGYVISMRDSVWPELFPSMCRGEFAMSVGEWRQFWASLFKRVADLFDQSIQGAQVVLGQTVQQNSTAAALARGLEPAAAAEEGLQARRDAVKLVWGHWLQFQLLRGADRRALVSVWVQMSRSVSHSQCWLLGNKLFLCLPSAAWSGTSLWTAVRPDPIAVRAATAEVYLYFSHRPQKYTEPTVVSGIGKEIPQHDFISRLMANRRELNSSIY
jgi:hypothetical protein